MLYADLHTFILYVLPAGDNSCDSSGESDCATGESTDHHEKRIRKTTELAVEQAIADSNASARHLLALCLPLHSILMFANYVLSDQFAPTDEVVSEQPQRVDASQWNLSPGVVLAYLAAGFLQVRVIRLFDSLWLNTLPHL